MALIKLQALVRGFLTRKFIFEELQRRVLENENEEYELDEEQMQY